MTTSRLEAFSDGVLAIILTIMVLELKVPIGGDLYSLKPLIPKFLNYLLSFIFIGIYWNNHHHLFHAIKKINGSILWANLLLLFWLSLLPVATGWMNEHFNENWPVAIYGILLVLSSFSFALIEKLALKHDPENCAIADSIANQRKEYLSTFLYILAVILSFYVPYVSIALYLLVALMWIIPDKRIERVIK